MPTVAVLRGVQARALRVVGQPLEKAFVYLLLWAAIERYAALRYHLGGDAVAKVMNVATERAFQEALAALPDPPSDVRMEVFRADNPAERYRLTRDSPAESLRFFYQIRNNSSHRGKAVPRDFGLMSTAAEQLLEIFQQVLTAAFVDATVEDNDLQRRR